MSVFTVTVLILLGLVTVLIFLAKTGRLQGHRKRIRILPKETVIILSRGDHPCPACGLPLREGEAVAKCIANAAHVVHKECKRMVKERCPSCGGKLESLPPSGSSPVQFRHSQQKPTKKSGGECRQTAEQARMEVENTQAAEQSRMEAPRTVPVTSPAPVAVSTRTEAPRTLLIDNVHFTVTGPSVLVPGTAHELQFWVHLEQQRSDLLVAASKAHRLNYSDMAVKSEGPYPLQRWSRISVRLKIDRLKCLDSHKWITWTGEIGNTAFVVVVPPHAPEGAYPGKASIRLNGCEIAKMSFVVHVGSPSLSISEIPSQTTPYRRAFASYASEDRAEVLSRVQGMEAAYKGLDVFVDVIDLRSGQNWEHELVQRIWKSDVFYLFWCRHAMKSVWVDKEWHWALAAKGQDFIDPIPLDTPELAPAPDELAEKQFNDPLLAFIAAAGGAHSSQE